MFSGLLRMNARRKVSAHNHLLAAAARLVGQRKPLCVRRITDEVLSWGKPSPLRPRASGS